jgi:hypothetical protein
MMAMNATRMMRLICARPSARCADMIGAARSVDWEACFLSFVDASEKGRRTAYTMATMGICKW